MTAEHWVSMEYIVKHLEVAPGSVGRGIDGLGLRAQEIGRPWRFKPSGIDDMVRTAGAEAHGEPRTSGVR